MKTTLSIFLSVVLVAGCSRLKKADQAGDSIDLIIRIDDIGFNHSTNLALQRLIDEGIFTSSSVIVTTPWLDEAAEILNEHPEVSVGVHLVLNSEWKEFKWGPVLPADEVPSLVNAEGHFFGTRANLMSNGPKVEEVAKELRAQIDLALSKGLDVSYVDYHMGMALSVWEFQQEVEKIAADYGIGISRYFGEADTDAIYRVPPDQKTEGGVSIIEGIEEPGLYLMVVHPSTDGPEMSMLTDLNPTGPSDMSKHRQGETDMLCSSEFAEAIQKRGIRLVGYDELRAKGLEHMERREKARPYDVVYEEALVATGKKEDSGY